MLIVGNWKAYVDSVAKAKALEKSAKRLASGKHEIAIAAPFPFLGMLSVKGSKLRLAAQDVSVTTGGAHTGEVSANLLAGLGVSYVIVGHSERRALGEPEDMIVEKVRHAFAHGITPILCVGETARDPDATYLKTVRSQIKSVMEALSPKERGAVVIAYEPVWAIGRSGLEAITAADLAEMILYIRKVLSDFIPGRGNAKVRIIYGGSVEPGNIRGLAEHTGVDGFLPGRASTDAATFTALVKAIS